jgi:hypothetical protein
MNETFWVLERPLANGFSWYYAGNANTTASIKYAFKFGTKELALEFLRRTKKDNRIRIFADYAPVEYQVEYKRVGR